LSGPRSFCSWSGGKDSCLALFEALQQGYRVELLVSMLGENGDTSSSHGIPTSLLKAQAERLGMEQLLFPRGKEDPEHPFLKAARAAVTRGCHHGIFGDIFVESHRQWIQDTARACGFTPVFPLWHRPTGELARAFLRAGFRALVVAARRETPGREILGRELSEDLLEELERKGLDPGGENGEYHTFVFDGPIFREPVPFEIEGIQEERERLLLKLRMRETFKDIP